MRLHLPSCQSPKPILVSDDPLEAWYLETVSTGAGATVLGTLMIFALTAMHL